MSDVSSSFPQLTRGRKDIAKELKAAFGDKLPKEVMEALEDDSKWSKCVHDVTKKQGSDKSPANAYAVCHTSTGEKKKESQKIQISSIKESSNQTTKGKKFEVVIIEEGLGNLGDCFYYGADVIRAMPKIFEGKKMFANHPSKSEESDRPERSVRDILAYFQGLSAQMIDGRTCLVGNAIIPNGPAFDWARSIMNEAISYGESNKDRSLIGISINASGDATDTPIDEVIQMAPDGAKAKLYEAKEKGIETVRVVTSITDAESADLVTEAGAGGKILKLMEGDKNMSHDKKEAGDDKGHPDADKDKKVVADMLKKHMGDDSGEPTDDHHEMYGEMEKLGHSKEEAAKIACAAVKHMAQKHKQAEEKKKEAGAADDKQEDEKKKSEGDDKKDEKKEKDEKESEKKESSKTLELAGRVAFLESELQKERTAKHIEAKLAKSGLKRSVTDTLKESIGAVKTEKEFDAKYELFLKGYNQKIEESADFLGFMPEKKVVSESQGLDLSECIKE